MHHLPARVETFIPISHHPSTRIHPPQSEEALPALQSLASLAVSVSLQEDLVWSGFLSSRVGRHPPSHKTHSGAPSPHPPNQHPLTLTPTLPISIAISHLPSHISHLHFPSHTLASLAYSNSLPLSLSHLSPTSSSLSLCLSVCLCFCRCRPSSSLLAFVHFAGSEVKERGHLVVVLCLVECARSPAGYSRF